MSLAAKIQSMPNVSSVYIPQSIDYPGLALNIDRERASLIGLSAKDVVDNVITAMTSDGMVAPSYWIDPKTGNNYMVTVQYANRWIDNMSMEDFEEHSSARQSTGRLLAGVVAREAEQIDAAALDRATTRRLYAARSRSRTSN